MPLTKAGSEVICSLKHGHLLIPRGELFPVNIGLILMLVTPTPPIILWTSLVVRNGTFLFEDGSEFSNEDFTLRRGDGECVALVVEKDSLFIMQQKPCLEEAIGFCESEVNYLIDLPSIFGIENTDNESSSSKETCPHGSNWQEHDETGFCYWETSYEAPRLSWEDARKYCHSYGGDLASLNSPEEERIGLGFQFGQTEHSFWIGLHYDTDTNNYVWVDGSPMNYTNWEIGQPNYADKRMRCGYMNSIKKKWSLSYCGSLSWFICKAPKQLNPPLPVPPTREPMIKCPGSETEYFFEDYCYQKISRLHGWHRAQQYCEDQQGNLVSLHSESEVDFLIRFLASYNSIRGNRIWIGLNSLALDGSFKWSDGSPVDFANWDIGEPNNFQNQEKCANMYAQHGMWNDENCNAVMNFVCKRRNGTVIEPSSTTPAPVVGYCQKDWYIFGDRCFLPVGLRKTQRKSWIEASLYCASLGNSYLASIRDIEDQAFMFYLIQSLKMDTWIGLHDRIHSGVFFWTDNSPLFYTNWAPSEPSSHGFQEDCALISYGGEYGGKWKDTDCKKQLPFICQTHRDPSITKPGELRGTRCPHLPGYLKQDLSCYKLFTDLKTWEEAQATCRKDGAHLVSISDMKDQAVVGYLAAEHLSENNTFWIGLKNTGKYPLQWVNKFPILFSKWGQNEPSIGPGQSASCYFSDVVGYWKGEQCSKKKSYICHHTAEEPPTPETKKKGPCPDDKSTQWYEVGNSCVFFGSKEPAQWDSAKFLCSSQGSHLASFHSMNELNSIQYYMPDATRQLYFIGLGKNSRGGFQWTDNTPVDFVNWDQDEPRDGDYRCVAMRMDTMKWTVVDCYSTEYYICAKEKETTNSTDSRNQSAPKDGESRGLHPGTVVAIVIGIIILVIAVVLGILHYRTRKTGWNRYAVHSTESVRSFENQTYDDLNNLDIHERNILYAKD